MKPLEAFPLDEDPIFGGPIEPFPPPSVEALKAVERFREKFGEQKPFKPRGKRNG